MGGPFDPPFLGRSRVKRVRNLFQNAGNGHFRDSNFQKFLGGIPQTPQKARAIGRRCCPLPRKLTLVVAPV